MKPETLKIMETVIKQDMSLTPLEQKKLIEKLKAPLDAQNTVEQITLAPEENKVIKRSLAAKMLGISPATIDRFANEHHIKKILYPNRVRAAGFLLGDLLRLQSNFKKVV